MKAFITITLLLIIMLIAGCSKINQVCVNEKCFKVEIADSSEERQIGLMNRERLGDDGGMWFVFDEEDKHSFWMKNVRFPIDIIWIDARYKVVDIKRGAKSCIGDCEIYSPAKDARYVLEVNINSSINVGDSVEVR